MRQICTRCINDETIPNISYNEEGICNYCQLHDQLELEYPKGAEGQNNWQHWFWWLMYKLNPVPKSFYLKYSAPDISSK